MKIGRTFLIIGIIIVLGVLIFILFNSNKVGLWKDCNPQTNNCKAGLECKRYGVTNIYRCFKYLKEGEECGISVAEICGNGLICSNTDKTRQRCGTFTTTGGQECFVEAFQICKSL